MSTEGGLGRRIPTDFEHVEKYPARALLLDPQHPLTVAPPNTEKGLGLPWWWAQHDQGQEGACVGFGCSAMMSVTNHRQRLLASGRDITFRYESRWLYQQAQGIDEWPETPPEEGTSVRAGCEILRARGHRRVQRLLTDPEPRPENGIGAYRWATTVDEIRSAIWSDAAVAIGVNWYSTFDRPTKRDGELWIGLDANAWVRGGHCVCLYRYSDRREAFRLMNSWGEEYPPVWLPYDVMQRLLDEYGEAVLITDR